MGALGFGEPVIMRSGETLREVRNASEAAQALAGDWPAARGKWYHAASRACRKAASGETPPHMARRMFEQAVAESRLGA